MEKTKTQTWQHWLRFSAFTLAGVAMEGSAPTTNTSLAPAPKAKKWRPVQ
ncbi:hypothetical protein [Pantoea rodasii]|nr:hypothetical protein [Pantoea rodasii]